MANIDYRNILSAYRALWNNRLLTADQNEEEVLKDAIVRELRDENSHPRVRKPLYEKFYWAVKRINASDLSNEDKNILIQLHVELLGHLIEGKA